MKDELHRKIIRAITSRPDRLAALVKWLREKYPGTMPSRFALQTKIEELIGEKL